MNSTRKFFANRKHAGRSTGPRTSANKRLANRNAIRHGLAVPIGRAPGASAEIDRLTMAIAGSRRDPAALEQARIAAEAELELSRVRDYRTSVIDQKTAGIVPRHDSVGLQNEGDPSASKDLNQEQTANAIAEVLPGLAMLERYQKRSLSRRKRALRWLVYTAVLI